MKDKETTNLLLILVVSIVLLAFLYLPQTKQNSTQTNFTNAKNEVPKNIESQKLNSSIVFKMYE